MYNTHRGMMPQHPPPAHNRLGELFDGIRQEFEANSRGAADQYNQERESIIRNQVQEAGDLRDVINRLEQRHEQVRQDYERQIQELTRELEVRRSGGQPAPHAGHPANPAPPAIGPSRGSDLFGQIMQGGGGQQGPLGPPPTEPPQPQGLPAHLTQGSGLNTGPQPPGHQPFSGYNGPAINGYPQGPPPPAVSPGPKGGNRAPPPGNSTPHQRPGVPPVHNYSSPRQHMATPPPGHRPPPGSGPSNGPPSGPPHHHIAPNQTPQASTNGAPPSQPPANLPNHGNDLVRYLDDGPPQQYFKSSEGSDWWAIFNPQIPRRLEVNLIHTLSHNSVVCCVRFSSDGRYIATGCNRSAQIFDVERGENVAVLVDESARGVSGDDKNEGDLYIRSVCFSPDGRYLATGAEDKIIRVWDIGRKEIINAFHGHEQDIYSLDFSRNGKVLASGSGDKTVKMWNLDSKAPGVTLSIQEGVTTVALSPDGRLVAAGSLDRSVRVWDVETGSPVAELDSREGHTDSVYSVAFSPSGDQLVSGSLDKKIKLWELPQSATSGSRPPSSGPTPKGRCVRTFEGHGDFVLSVALTHDRQWVLSGSKDRGVVFWDPNTGDAQLHLQGHRNSVISVAPSPRGGVFATGSGDARCRVWSYSPV